MIATHAVTATIGAYTLDVKDAKITLDDGWSPYCQATLMCALPPEATLDTIDPRTVPAPRVLITLTRDVGAQSRTFNLVLVERSVDHDPATMTLTCASDEQLLIDYARVATTVDTSARGYQSSLRAVLGSVILPTIGAALEAGASDFDTTVDTSAINLIPNPSNEGTAGSGFAGGSCSLDINDTGWTAHGARSLNLYSPTSADSFLYIGGDSGALRLGMVAGKTYTFSATGRVKRACSGTAHACARRLNLQYRIAAGAYVSTVSAAIPNVVGAAARVSVQVTLPPGTTEAFVRAYLGHMVGEVQWDAFRLSETTGSADDTYFDGSTPATAMFAYAWTGTANASTSTRTGLLKRDAKMLDWEPGESAWDFVAPLIQTSGLRLYCDERRRWLLVDPATPVDGQINITAGVNLTDGRDTISRSRDWFDAVVVEYSWNDEAGSSKVAWDVAGAPGTKVLTLRYQRPYPGPGAAASVLDRSRGRGRVLDISALSDYAATPGIAVQATLPASPIQTGFVSAVTWSLPADEMTVKSRGLTDTPATAWMFLAPGVKWTDSPVGASWTAETV